MIDDKRERRTALWWIEHESTNEFWSLRNPWVVGPLVLLVVIVLCALATFFWGMPRVVADVITKGIVFGYLLILFIYQLRAKRRTAAIGTAVIGGMLAATCIATLFVPYFFKAIMQLSLKLQGKKDPNEGKSRFDDDPEDI